MTNRKTQLALGVASAALITGLATPVHAACDIDGATVTCTADSTAAEVNAALAAAGGGDVTLNVVADANVTQPGSPVTPPQQDAVAIDNAGALGTPDARVGVRYSGTSSDSANTFDLVNSGAITDRVEILNVGGDMNIANSGLLGNGVLVSTQSDGAINFISTGDIDSDFFRGVELYSRGDISAAIDGDVGSAATDTDASDLRDVLANSQQFISIPSTTTTETDGGVTTTTTTSGFTRVGGTSTINIGVDANTGQVEALGLDGAAVDVAGRVGSDTEYEIAVAFSNTQERRDTQITTNDGTDSSTTDISETNAIGGNATVAVAETGFVSGFVYANGLIGATVMVDGTVGTENQAAGAYAFSTASDFRSESSNSTIGSEQIFTSSSDDRTVGGVASISVGESGVVTGPVNARGWEGAVVTIDGAVGTETGFDMVLASSTGSQSNFTSRFAFDTVSGSSSNEQSSMRTATGGSASVAVGETGFVRSSVQASGNVDASVANAGTIDGSVRAIADASNSTSSFSSTNTGAGDGSSSNSFRFERIGGDATIDNAAGALIGLDPTLMGS